MFGHNVFQGPCLKVVEESKQENHLKLKVTIGEIGNNVASEISSHKINPSVSVYIKVLFIKSANIQKPVFGASNIDSGETRIFVLFKFFKNDMSDDVVYSITCSSDFLKLTNKTYLTDNDSWYLVNETPVSLAVPFNVEFKSKIIISYNPFQTLYEDNELIDFQLIGQSGQVVKIHGAVLAAQCPSLMKMINDKSIKDHVIEYSDVQGETLQHFKDYLYLKKLPNNNITQLLLLASKFSMPVLEQQCIDKIINTLTGANIYELIEFSQKHKLYELFIDILDCIQNGKVKVDDIRKSMSV